MNIKSALTVCLLGSLINMVACGPTLACTDFMIKAKDGSIVEGRTMEWGEDLKSQVTVHLQGEERVSRAPDGKPGVKWRSKYGFLNLNGYGLDMTLDGMNEKGLSVSVLWMPGSVYQSVPSGRDDKALNAIDLGNWILGNFATVAEVKGALGQTIVCAEPMKELSGGIPTVHIAIHDAQGHSGAVEFIDGKQKFYDNPNGVLTNAPTLDWHLTNLRNYIQVSPMTPIARDYRGTVLGPPGNGGGFLGIPGDWTPPSRFVRTTAMLAFASPADDAPGALTLAQHILNAVDIPLGDIRVDSSHRDYTQWAVIKDLTNGRLYYHTYDDLTLRTIDMRQLDFKPGASAKSIAISGSAKNAIVDVTSSLQ